MLRWLLVVVGVALLAAALVPVGVTWIERRQSRDLAPREPYASGGEARRIAVVYFSRSGNTALAARHIARRLDAALFEIQAPDYALGLKGWVHAMRDAPGGRADISPRTLDLQRYDTVYLGSPIWLYSPAPPIWAFVENNRLDGKRVVLFNTFNSQFKQEYIETFRAKVMAQGARSFEHRFVRRGRMTRQMGPDEMLATIDAEWFIEDREPAVHVPTP